MAHLQIFQLIKQPRKMRKELLNIGIVGHTDHSKTAFVEALCWHYGPHCPPNKMEVDRITNIETGLSVDVINAIDKMMHFPPQLKAVCTVEKVLVEKQESEWESRRRMLTRSLEDCEIRPTLEYATSGSSEKYRPKKHRYQEIVIRDPKRKKVKAARKAARASKRKRK